MKQAERIGPDRQMAEAEAPLAPAPVRVERAETGQVLAAPRPALRLSTPGKVVAKPATVRVRAALSAAAKVEADRGLAFLFLPVAMGAGAGIFYMASTDPDPVLVFVGLIIALVFAVLAGRTRPAAARIAGFVAALCAGAVAAGIEARSGSVLLDSDVITRITGTVEAREFDDAGRVRYLIRLHATADPEIRRAPGRVRLVARSPHEPVPVGATIAGRARLSAPSGPVLPGGYDFAFRAFVDGVGAHGFFYQAPEPGAPGIRTEAFAGGMIETFHFRLRDIRERISARFRAVLPGDPGGIAAALAVSDRSGISPATVDALRATGLAHILAISGLHMALAAGTLYIGVRRALAIFPGLPEAMPVKKIAAMGALVTATAYLLISGGSVSTQRAWVMISIMLVAVLADRSALTMRNVALAAIVIILLTPSAVVGPGFQMSFAATAALISAYAVLAGRARDGVKPQPGPFAGSAPGRWLTVFARALLGLAITSLVAGLATGLFSAHHFHRVAGNGVLANVLAMPLVTFVVMPAGLMALLLMPFGLDALPLQVMGKGLEGVIAAANYVESLGGDIVVGQVPLSATVAAGAGFVILVFLRSWLRLGGVALVILGAALALPPIRGPGPDVLVSEDGTLIALAGPAGLASNAARPNDFVFRQWQTGLRAADHLPPVTHPPGDPGDPRVLDRLLEAAATEPSRFHCAGRGVCAAIHRRARIIAINQVELIGAACDRAALVVVAIPVHMRACFSGATLITARSLRQTGALTIRIPGQGPDGAAATADPAERLENGRTRPDMRIDSALGGVIRPWTIQRYYDWRTGRYDVPGGFPPAGAFEIGGRNQSQ